MSSTRGTTTGKAKQEAAQQRTSHLQLQIGLRLVSALAQSSCAPPNLGHLGYSAPNVVPAVEAYGHVRLLSSCAQAQAYLVFAASTAMRVRRPCSTTSVADTLSAAPDTCAGARVQLCVWGGKYAQLHAQSTVCGQVHMNMLV